MFFKARPSGASLRPAGMGIEAHGMRPRRRFPKLSRGFESLGGRGERAPAALHVMRAPWKLAPEYHWKPQSVVAFVCES
jgi:hypothetical protein